MVIWKCTDVFQGGYYGLKGCGEGAMWKDLSLEDYVMGPEKFDEGGAGFSRIIIKKTMTK